MDIKSVYSHHDYKADVVLKNEKKENLDKSFLADKEVNLNLFSDSIHNVCSEGSASSSINFFTDTSSNNEITKGKISLKLENNKIVAFREPINNDSKSDILARREESFQIFSKLHFAKKDEFISGSLEITKEQKDLFHKFAMTDIGSNLIQKVIDDDIEAFNKGYLELNIDSITDKSNFVDIISGKLSTDAEFEAYNLFKVYGYEGGGASGQSGAIALGNKGFKESFATGEKVDPMAILSHEFGHTKYGDPSSGETLEGEAQTVLKYENPMRKVNGFEDREIYYSPKENISIEVKNPQNKHNGILNIENLKK